MTPFTQVSGPAAPLMAANVDTDVIIRIERLSDIARGELGPYAFEAWRYDAEGAEKPEFVLNQPDWRGAPILLAGPNFGCGSSREGAVWALNGMGVRAVIAPSFGDIHYNNCIKNGIINGYSMIAHDDPMGKTFLSNTQLPPLMLSDLFDSKSFFRVCIQDLGQDILGVF